MFSIIFDNHEDSKLFVLQSIGKEVDEEGYIMDSETKERVLLPNGEELLFKDFAGVKKGSEIFIKSDIISLVEYVNRYR